jgi:hypothetical protein
MNISQVRKKEIKHINQSLRNSMVSRVPASSSAASEAIAPERFAIALLEKSESKNHQILFLLAGCWILFKGEKRKGLLCR